MAVREFITDITTVNGGGKAMVMYFDEAAATAADQRVALIAYITAFKVALSNTTSFTIRNSGKVLLEATGALSSTWTTTANTPIVGNSATAPVNDATQVLQRWRTNTILRNRFVQGRQFIPGLVQTSIVGGNLLAGARTDFITAGAGLITSAKGFGIWSKPWAGSPSRPAYAGFFAPATAADCWTELAVLRRRRY